MAIKFLSTLNLSDVTAGSILKVDSNGNIVAATAGTDYVTSNLWTTTSSDIYRNSSVRIGTYQTSIAPDAKLHVFDYQTTTPKILIEDGNTGDASMQFKISTQQYTMGIDNSDSDKFVLAASSALGTTNALEISTTGTTTLKSTAYFKGDAYFDADGQTFYFTADDTSRTTIRWQIDSGNKYVLSTVGANSLYWGREPGNTSGHIELETPVRVDGSLTVNTDSYTNTITAGHSGTLNLIDTKTLLLDDSFGTNDGRVFGVLQPAPFKPSDITLGDSAYASSATDTDVANTFPNVKGEADATGITNNATFTFAEALAQAETLGGRLPTLEEILSGVGAGSGQGYDGVYLWTQTKAGHGKYWVAKGDGDNQHDAIVVDINASTPPEYSMRIFYDISKDNMPVYYDNSSNIRTTSIKAENADGIALRALDGDIGITIKDDATVKLNQYTAGLLKTDASGNISLDTSTYLTSVSVDWSDIGSINGTINVNSTTQIGEGDTETLVSFQNSGTERGSFQVDSSANSYFVATGFKTTGSSTGLLKSDGTIDTSTYATTADINSFIEITDVATYLSTNNYITTGYTGFDSRYVLSTGGYYDEDFTWDGTHDFSNVIKVSGAAATTTNTTALFYGANGVIEKRDLGSNAFNSTSYLTSYTETDTLDSVTGRGATTTNNISVGNLTAVGGTFTDPVTIYDSTTTENPRLSVGRNAGESIQFDVTDVVNTITAKQDADSNSIHTFVLDRVFGGTGDSVFSIHNDGTPDLTIDGSGVVSFNQYNTAGILKVNASGTISVDTNTYSTASGVADNADNYGSWTVSDGTNTEAITSGTTVAWRGSGATSVEYDSSTNQFSISSTNTEYSNATTSTAGLMSSTDKSKLDGIASGAEVNVQSDWNATTGDAFIKNKPTLGTAAASAATDFVAVSGDTMTGTLALDNADSLSFESGKHWITYNDGEGNFNIRVGHKSDSTLNEVSTETGYAFHDEWSQSSGWREFNVSGTSITAGDDVGTWRRQMYYDYNDVQLAYQGSVKFKTTNTGITVTGEIATTGGNSTNWNTAYGWGNHADGGYLTTASAALTYATTDHGHSDATQEASGFMSSTDKTKLDGMTDGAEPNVQADWNATSGDAFIQNKPTLGTAASKAVTNFVQDFGTTAQSNINTIGAASGKYRWNNSTTGRPASSQSNEYGTLLHLQYDSGYATQLAYDIAESNLYIRHLALATDTGSSWKRLLTTSDEGSGNGLDADTVDGLQASQFLRSDTPDVMEMSTSSEMLTLKNNTSGQPTQIGLRTNDTDGNHHRAYIKASKSSAGSAAGKLELIIRSSGGGTTEDVFVLEAGKKAIWGGDNLATESYVGTAVSNLVDSAPAALNTLNELAAALGDDASFSTTMSTALGNRLRIDVNNQSLSSTELSNARTNLGLGTAATSAATDFVAVSGDQMTGKLEIAKESQHVTQGSISANNAHLDLYNTWSSNTDQKGSIITFTDNYFDGSNYVKTLRAAIKGGTDTVGNTADGYLEFYTDSAGANSPNLVLRLDKNKNANFYGSVTVSGRTYLSTVDANASSTTALVLGTSGEIEKRTLGSNAFNSTAYLEDITPATPSVDSATVVGETIEITFSQSSTPGVDYYQVWSAVGSSTGSYGLIAHIPQEDVASSMTVIDATFNVSDTMYYRVYAVKSGIYSTAGTTSRAFSASGLDVSNMSVVNLNTAYYIQYEMPDSRFVDHVEIYMDAEATASNLTRTGATLVYSGNNTSYMYKIGANDLDKYHQFWVEVVES